MPTIKEIHAQAESLMLDYRARWPRGKRKPPTGQRPMDDIRIGGRAYKVPPAQNRKGTEEVDGVSQSQTR